MNRTPLQQLLYRPSIETYGEAFKENHPGQALMPWDQTVARIKLAFDNRREELVTLIKKERGSSYNPAFRELTFWLKGILSNTERKRYDPFLSELKKIAGINAGAYLIPSEISIASPILNKEVHAALLRRVSLDEELNAVDELRLPSLSLSFNKELLSTHKLPLIHKKQAEKTQVNLCFTFPKGCHRSIGRRLLDACENISQQREEPLEASVEKLVIFLPYQLTVDGDHPCCDLQLSPNDRDARVFLWGADNSFSKHETFSFKLQINSYSTSPPSESLTDTQPLVRGYRQLQMRLISPINSSF